MGLDDLAGMVGLEGLEDLAGLAGLRSFFFSIPLKDSVTFGHHRSTVPGPVRVAHVAKIPYSVPSHIRFLVHDLSSRKLVQKREIDSFTPVSLRRWNRQANTPEGDGFK